MTGPYQLHKTLLSASPSGCYYEHELVDVRDGRIIYSQISKSPIAPRQVIAYQARMNTTLILDLSQSQ